MLKPEWRKRLEHWRKTLAELCYTPIGEIEFSGFTFIRRLSPGETPNPPLRPMPPGTRWGEKWEYGRFIGHVTLAPSLKGQRIAARIDVGGEAAVSVNHREAGAVDTGHREITLVRCAAGGEQFEIQVDAYAGNGARILTCGPVPPGRESVPEVRALQAVVGTSTYGIWQEEIYQLCMDLETLLIFRDNCRDRESLRLADVDEVLMTMTLAVDPELPMEELLPAVREGRRILRKAMRCKNGSTVPLMTCFGHSHIDIAWLWPLRETGQKCSRTFSTQLALMEEYPEYRYLQSQPFLYEMTRKEHPALYQRIREAVRRKQWIPEGGMYVEADTNLSGGESLIRQFLYGKRFFREEFQIESELMWLPDVFGYSGALPQIMKGCGINYFSTQKIFWTYNGGEPFPCNLFYWEGIDGSRVLSYLHNDYNSLADPGTLLKRWDERVQKSALHRGRLFPFGYGDGGGGPNRTHLEFLRREKNFEGLPRCEIAHPNRFFETIGRDLRRKLPVYVGELYFQGHRGTYTSQAKTKKGNRLSEITLREAELWNAFLRFREGTRYPAERFDALWKEVLLNQFHDIIPGSSIERVYEEAEAAYAHVVAESGALAGQACQALSPENNSDALTVFNSLSWPRGGVVKLPEHFKGAAGPDGGLLPVQEWEGGKYARTPEVPAVGWTVIRNAPAGQTPSTLKVTPTLLENKFVRVRFDAKGRITSLYDKTARRELAAGLCNRFRLYKDIPASYDAWDIDRSYKFQEIATDEPARVSVLASGPLWGAIRLEREIGHSMIRQDIILSADSCRLDFRTVVEWRESHRLLKVDFPVNYHCEDALHEIQFGYLRRPTHASRPFDETRYEVCNHKWSALTEENRGFALLNDCKYGINVAGNTLSLTLLKSAMAPDMHADKGVQEFSYGCYFWNGSFREGGVVREGYEFNIPLRTSSGGRNEESLLSVSDPTVILETVKCAEDGSGDLIARLYESSRSTVSCEVVLPQKVRAVFLTNMLEQTIRELHPNGGRLKLDFSPFEIKTIRLVKATR